MKTPRILLGLIAGAVLLAPAGGYAADAKIALASAKDLEKSGGYVWAHTFGSHLSANGFTVEEFERGALGEEAERLDQVSQGLLEVSMSDLKQAGQFDKFVFGATLPYLFEDVQHLDRVLNEGGLLAQINQSTTPNGVRVLALVIVGTPSGIFNTKHAVARPADMTDLRMRALDDRQIELFQAWGTNGTIVSWSEVPNALQTGVADGYINPAIVPLLFGHNDFLKHFTDAGVIMPVRAALASEDWYQGLSESERGIVDAAARLASEANLDWVNQSAGAVLGELEAAGIQVTTLTADARAAFEQLSVGAYQNIVPSEDVDVWVGAAEQYR